MLSPLHKPRAADTSLHLEQSFQYDFLLAIKVGDCCFEMHKVPFIGRGRYCFPSLNLIMCLCRWKNQKIWRNVSFTALWREGEQYDNIVKRRRLTCPLTLTSDCQQKITTAVLLSPSSWFAISDQWFEKCWQNRRYWHSAVMNMTYTVHFIQDFRLNSDCCIYIISI